MFIGILENTVSATLTIQSMLIGGILICFRGHSSFKKKISYTNQILVYIGIIVVSGIVWTLCENMNPVVNEFIYKQSIVSPSFLGIAVWSIVLGLYFTFVIVLLGRIWI